MNKKFSTLVASLLLAGAFTAYAQKDVTSMPRSAAFLGKDVTKLEQVGTGQYGSENRFYQLADGSNKVLSMMWNATSEKYELKMVALTNSDIPLDNTLWQVSAQWDQTSGTLNYIFVNKATLLPLQVAVPTDYDDDVDTPDANTDAYVNASSAAKTVTNWRWNNNAEALGQAPLHATVSTTETLGLYVKSSNDEVFAVKYKTGISGVNSLTAQISATSTDSYSQVELRPVEAGRVILTAEQINTKLSNATGKDAERLDIVFNPEVKNPDADLIKNVITENAWVAYGDAYKFTSATNHALTLDGDPAEIIDFSDDDPSKVKDMNATGEYYVQLRSYKEPGKVLMVDTAYYDTAMNDKYNLQLIKGELVKKKDKYDSGLVTTGTSYSTFQDQSLFMFVYEPSFDRVLIMAKQITNVPKKNLKENFEDVAGESYKPFAYQTTRTATTPLDVAMDGTIVATTSSYDLQNANYKPVNENLIKLDYLTPSHSELTVGDPDANDILKAEKGYEGALTQITLKGTKQVFGQWTYAEIPEGYYYIQNVKKQSSSLIPSGAWAYQDLTATNNSNYGNVVYSTEKFTTMPSAQWYIEGKGGVFKLINRESSKEWSTNMWYAVKDENGNTVKDTYTNYGTFGANGISTGAKDTIKIEAVPESVLTAKNNGYLYLSQAVANADTSVFTFKYVTPLEVNLNMDMKADSTLVMSADGAMNFKLERVSTQNSKYGHATENKYKLERVSYYMYADEVSSNSTEETGYRERKYVVLEGGQYRLSNKVVTVNPDGTTSLANDDRAEFLVKEIGEAGKNYVLVDPNQIDKPAFGQGTDADGVRMAMDQVSLSMRANGLPSVAENVYSNSLLNIVPAAKGNYESSLAYGDTVKIFSNEYPEVVMYENNKLAAMSSLEVGRTYNTAMFVDTAYVRDNTARPQYMFVMRPVEDPNCNFPNHEHHAIEGAYLMHMQDSVSVDANKYTWDNKKFARLGFVDARHEGDSLIVKSSKFTGNKTTLYPNAIDKDQKALTVASQDTMNLADNSKDQYATFALRYVDTNRDAFYLETLYKKGTPADKYNNAVADKKGWVRWHNGVPVVVDDLAQAGKFNFNTTNENPTANDEVSAEAGVSVVASNGAVIIKNAAGKKVAISNILGKAIANETIASDNETIAVPAGIVVVAVEGEEAVKTVVK